MSIDNKTVWKHSSFQKGLQDLNLFSAEFFIIAYLWGSAETSFRKDLGAAMRLMRGARNVYNLYRMNHCNSIVNSLDSNKPLVVENKITIVDDNAVNHQQPKQSILKPLVS